MLPSIHEPFLFPFGAAGCLVPSVGFSRRRERAGYLHSFRFRPDRGVGRKRYRTSAAFGDFRFYPVAPFARRRSLSSAGSPGFIACDRQIFPGEDTNRRGDFFPRIPYSLRDCPRLVRRRNLRSFKPRAHTFAVVRPGCGGAFHGPAGAGRDRLAFIRFRLLRSASAFRGGDFGLGVLLASAPSRIGRLCGVRRSRLGRSGEDPSCRHGS